MCVYMFGLSLAANLMRRARNVDDGDELVQKYEPRLFCLSLGAVLTCMSAACMAGELRRLQDLALSTLYCFTLLTLLTHWLMASVGDAYDS